MWRLKNKIEYAFALFLKKGLAGLSCAESMMHLCNNSQEYADLEWTLFWAWSFVLLLKKLNELVGTKSSTQSFVAACKERGMWTTCWWLSLLQLVHLGIHHDSVSKNNCLLVVGSSLRRPPFLLSQTRSSVSEQCEIGEQGGFGPLCWETISSHVCARRGFLARLGSKLLSNQRRTPAEERWLSGLPSILVLSWESSYLVDPASSHMLVSKIKPCMSKYKQICTVKLRMAH